MTKASTPSSRGPRWLRLAFLLVGAIFLAGLLWYLEPAEIFDALRTADPRFLAVSLVLTAAGFWIRAWKWRHALGKGRQAVGLFFIAKMAGHWSPGRIGELSPLFLRKHRNARVAAWIVADRALEAGTTLLFGLAGAAALGLLQWWLALLLAAVLVGLGVTVVTLRIPVPEGGHPWLTRVLSLLQRLHVEMRSLGARTLGIAASTLLAKVTDVLGVVFLCQAFGYNVSFLLVCVARCAHAIVSGVPVTPDATGIPFAAAGYFLHTHGGMPVETLVAAFGIEVAIINVVLYVSFFIGMLDMRGQREKEGSDHVDPI